MVRLTRGDEQGDVRERRRIEIPNAEVRGIGRDGAVAAGCGGSALAEAAP